MISIGEEKLPKAILSALPLVDEVVVVDTTPEKDAVEKRLLSHSSHSGDVFRRTETGSIEVAASAFSKPISVRIGHFDWVRRFNLARDHSFSLASHDWILWMDSDDLLKGASDIRAWWDRRANVPAVVVGRYDYEKREGKTILRQMRERIVPRRLGQWSSRIHEIWTSPRNLRSDPWPAHCFVDHDRDGSSDEAKEKMLRNIEYMQEDFEESTKEGRAPDRRLFYHYILSLVCVDRIPEAIKAAKLFLPGEHPGFEKARVWLALADAYNRIGRWEDAKGAASAALVQEPMLITPYVLLANLSFRNQEFDRCLFWFKLAYEMGERHIDQQLWVADIQKPNWMMACMSSLNLKQWDAALQYARRANDREMAKDIQDQIVFERDCKAVIEIVSRDDVPVESRRQIVEALPIRFRLAGAVSRLGLPEIPKDRPSIFIHVGVEGMSCGRDGQPWGPDSLEEGIGGSEEAVIRLSREIAALGAHVELYGPFSYAGFRDGVFWERHEAYDSSRVPDLFVAWRYTGLLRVAPNGARTALWAHDALVEGQIEEIPDEIWGLSDYHLNVLRAACPKEDRRPVFWKTSNGIPGTWESIADRPDRDPGRCFYGSSPDRGLEILLRWWPKIVEGVKKNGGPTPSLHIYYGFNIWWMEAEKADPEKRKIRETIEKTVKDLEPLGVIWHGAVGQPKLHRDMRASNVWLYPTRFNEISCITAMKAQALGAIPVCSRYAALSETVQFGDRFGSSDKDDIEEHEQDFVEAAVLRICSPDEEERSNMMSWAREAFLWSKVSDQWFERIKEIRRGRCVADETRPDSGTQRVHRLPVREGVRDAIGASTGSEDFGGS